MFGASAFFASSRHARTHFFSRNEEGSDAFSIRAATPVMTRGSLGGAFAREKRSRSVDVLRNGARAVGEATRPSPEAAVAPVLVGKLTRPELESGETNRDFWNHARGRQRSIIFPLSRGNFF